MQLSPVQKAFGALILANIIWGAASPIFKLSLENIPPYTLAFIRFFLASLILGFILRKNWQLPAMNLKDELLVASNAVFGITINIIFFFLGLQRTYSINAPVIASAAPILTLIFAMMFLGEPFERRKLAGMLLGVVGILAIIFEPLLQTGIDGSITGNIFLVIATLGAVVAGLTGRVVFQKYDPLVLTLWTFVIGTISFLPFALVEWVTIPGILKSLDWRGYLGIVYGAIFSSSIAYTIANWGLSKISATDSSLFTYIDPVAGAILAVILLHEPITVPFLFGSTLIFIGIFIAEGRLHYHPVHKLVYKDSGPINPRAFPRDMNLDTQAK